jgi:deazaflavin-dependent oxidoreductase (nitroreductase family)
MRAVARITAPLSRPLAGRRFLPLWAIVHHRGRRSGRSYAVPVAIRASDDAFTIPLPWGENSQWVRNVLAAGECTIRWRGSDHHASAPRVIPLAEGASAFHPVQRAILGVAGVRLLLRAGRAGDRDPVD